MYTPPVRKNGKSAGKTKLSISSQPNSVEVARRVAKSKGPTPPEVKFWDSGVFTTVIDNSGTNLLDACAIAQGTNIYQRVGDQIDPLFLDVSVTALSNSASVASTAFRMIVIQSLGAEISAPAFDDVINNVQGTMSLSAGWFSFQFPQQSKAYKLLHDETFVQSKYGQFGDLVAAKRRINLAGCRSVDYTGTGTSVNDNGGGRIYFYLLSSEAGTNGQYANYTLRLSYTDS